MKCNYFKPLLLLLTPLLVLTFNPPAGEAFFFSKKTPESSKYLIAVMPFENETGESSINDLGREACKEMLENLYNASVFKLVEMENIGEVLGEPLKDPYLDRQSYLKAIKSLGAEMILIGTIHSLSYQKTKKGLTEVKIGVSARLVNLMNGEIVFMGSQTGKGRQGTASKGSKQSFNTTDPIVSKAVRDAVKDLSRSITRQARFKNQ